jgi:hypothetical protein
MPKLALYCRYSVTSQSQTLHASVWMNGIASFLLVINEVDADQSTSRTGKRSKASKSKKAAL